MSDCPFPSTGSSIGYLRASDRDEANTFNSILKYKLVDHAPKVPSDGLFLIEEYEGKLQLGKRSLKKQDNPLYTLKVEVADRGEFWPWDQVTVSFLLLESQEAVLMLLELSASFVNSRNPGVAVFT